MLSELLSTLKVKCSLKRLTADGSCMHLCMHTHIFFFLISFLGGELYFYVVTTHYCVVQQITAFHLTVKIILQETK